MLKYSKYLNNIHQISSMLPSSYVLCAINIIVFFKYLFNNGWASIYYVHLLSIIAPISILSYFFCNTIIFSLIGLVVSADYANMRYGSEVSIYYTVPYFLVGVSIGFTLGTLCEELDKVVCVNFV